MTEKRQAPHLLNESPILVYPTLAVALGINKAVVFQQLHFLLNGQKTSNNVYNFVDDRWWVYNSYAEWRHDYFPWLSISSLKGIFNQLEDQKLVIARQSMKNKSDRRKWYTIDYETWDKFCLIIGQKVSDGSSDKKYPLVGQEMSDGYSETSSEASQEKKKPRTPSKKKELTDLERWQVRMRLVAPIMPAILAKMERGYDTAEHTPETYLNLALLEKYVPLAEEVLFYKPTPQQWFAFYGEISDIYNRNGWTVGIKTVREKFPGYMARQNTAAQKKAAPQPSNITQVDIELSPAEVEARKQQLAAVRKAEVAS